MKEFDDKILITLRKNVEIVFGKKILLSKDCTALALEISKATTRLISETTLKRVWNLVNSSFNPSQYTLDTMALYLGFQNWDLYIGINRNTTENGFITMWEKIKSRATLISQRNLDVIKKRSGIDYNKTLNRFFAEKKVEDFLISDKTATTFISPGGYGKTTLIAKVVEKLFLSENSKYPNDIVWFIDSGMIDLEKSNESDEENTQIRLLSETTPFESFINFFAKNPNDIKGRMLLIIDGLNEISTNYSNIEKIIDNIIQIIELNKNNLWFKIILTTRNNTWSIFQTKIESFTNQKEYWFESNFEKEYQISTNVPLLTNEEIIRILKLNNININFENLLLNSLDSIEIIRIPYFLFIYISLFHANQNISDIDLLTEFFAQKNIIGKESKELELIFKFIEKLNLGVNKKILFRNEIENLLNENETEFKTILNQGIIYETDIKKRILQKDSCIKFTHEILSDFLISKYWISKYELNIELLARISEYYKENVSLRCNILMWIIKFAFKESNIEMLKKIYDFLDTNFNDLKQDILNKPALCNLVSAIGMEIRQYPEVQKQLLPFYASNKNAVYFYFEKFWDVDYINLFTTEVIDEYLRVNKQASKQVFGYFIKFTKIYNQNNTKELREVFEQMSALDFSNIDHSTFNLYLHCKVLYQCLILGKTNYMIVDYIKEIESDYIKTEQQLITEVNYNIIAVMDAYNLVGMHDDAVNISLGILKNYNIEPKARHSRFYKYLQILCADSLLQIGREKEAYDIFNQIDIYSETLYSSNSKFFWLMRFILIKINFLTHSKNFVEVLKKYEEVRTYAKMLKFTRIELICKKRIKIIKEKNFND